MVLEPVIHKALKLYRLFENSQDRQWNIVPLIHLVVE
jgi:hypothetical protein